MNMTPTLSKWRIDKPRQHATKVGEGLPVLQEPIFRSRQERLVNKDSAGATRRTSFDLKSGLIDILIK